MKLSSCKTILTTENTENSLHSLLSLLSLHSFNQVNCENRVNRVNYLSVNSVVRSLQLAILIIFLIIPLAGCKKEQAVEKKPMAEKVQPSEPKKNLEAPEETKKVEQEVYTYEAKGRRDPFLSLVTVSKQKLTRKKGASPVESYGVDVIEVIAIARDKEKYYALITLPDKKSYTITEGMTLGLHGGRVQKITKDMVVIREYIKNYRGDIKPKDSVLKLRKEEGE